jgi:hypothetical protein
MTNVKKLTGYLIDPFQKRIHDIETTDDLEDWHKLLDCQILDVARVEREIDIWVNDEGLLRKPYYPLFYYLGFGNPLCGYGLALSSNSQGETISLNRPPGYLQAKIQFEEWEKRLDQEEYFEQMSRIYPLRHMGKFGLGATDIHVCSICKKPYQGFGNNAQPFSPSPEEGRCCDECNRAFVIPARLQMQREGKDFR